MSKLSVFKYGVDYPLWKPRKFFSTFFRRLKWGWQRATKGYFNDEDSFFSLWD